MVEVTPTTQQTIALSFLDNANARNYIDPTLTQNIMCSQTQDTKAYVQYEMTLLRLSDNSVIFNSVTAASNSAIQVSGNALSIPRNTLTEDNYQLTCKAYNIKYLGALSKSYTTTLKLSVAISFTVSPSSGLESDTVYSLKAFKPNGQSLWCKFGYVTSTGDQQITDTSAPVYSTSTQKLDT